MTTVLKFGSSVLPTERDVPGAVHEIYRWVRRGERVVAIVSAIGRTTDRLLAQAAERTPRPEANDLAAHLAWGEAEAVRLLVSALERVGVPCSALDPGVVGPWTEGDPLNAEPVGFDAGLVRRTLDRTPVVVLPGFVGRDAQGRTTLLGRGGSDLTAVFVAHRLKASRCRLLKDVDGIYTGDPNAGGSSPLRYRACHWDEAASVGGRIVQRRAVEFARVHSVPFEVAAVGATRSTGVGSLPSSTEPAMPTRAPLRVGLLGLGVVGLGVYERLASRPDLFEVVRIAVRDPSRARPVQRELLTTDPWSIVDERCDLVVEAIHGVHPAAAIISAALDAGSDVVTANKAVAAGASAMLALAARADRVLRCSACVGGSTPVIETVERLAQTSPIRRLRGVLNTTSNYVAGEIARGAGFDDALRRARDLGLAEEDASDDLLGRDAARKLAILARTAFASELDLARIPCDVVDATTPRGLVPVASLERDGPDLCARVGLERLDAGDPLARAAGTLNVIEVTLDDGTVHVVEGTGAGRWPTTESVIADCFDIARQRLEPSGRSAGIAPLPAHA